MKISINIELEAATELVDAISQLTRAFAQIEAVPASPALVPGNVEFLTFAQLAPRSHPVTIAEPEPAPELEASEAIVAVAPPNDTGENLLDTTLDINYAGFGEAAVAAVTDALTVAAEVAPVTHRSPTVEAAPPAINFIRTPESPKPSAQQRLAANKVGADLATKRRVNGAGMDFEQFDAMVKREVKRLAAGRTMPSHALWNEMRDPQLPILSSVMRRYGAGTAEELATMLGYNPPLRGIRRSQRDGEETQETEAVPA